MASVSPPESADAEDPPDMSTVLIATVCPQSPGRSSGVAIVRCPLASSPLFVHRPGPVYFTADHVVTCQAPCPGPPLPKGKSYLGNQSVVRPTITCRIHLYPVASFLLADAVLVALILLTRLNAPLGT